MDKINKLSLPATIIIVSLILGGFFYAAQINKQKSIERQQLIEIEQKKQEQLDKELKEEKAKEEAKQGLTTCLANAEESYSNNWRSECKARGLLTSRCISLNEMTFDEYVKQNNIPSGSENLEKRLDAIKAFYKEKEECSCSLPLYIADRLNESLEKDKDNCFRRQPQ
jgi:hypothetical protein